MRQGETQHHPPGSLTMALLRSANLKAITPILRLYCVLATPAMALLKILGACFDATLLASRCAAMQGSEGAW